MDRVVSEFKYSQHRRGRGTACTAANLNAWVTEAVGGDFARNRYTLACHLLQQTAYLPGCTYMLPYDGRLQAVSQFIKALTGTRKALSFYHANAGSACGLTARNLSAANQHLVLGVYAGDTAAVDLAEANQRRFLAGGAADVAHFAALRLP